MMLDSIFLPFRIPDLYGGIAEIRGILKATNAALVLDFEMKDSFLELFKLDSKVVTIALADIARVELKTGLFRRCVVIAANRLEAVRQVPGSNAGEIRLKFARKDTATAEEFVSCVQMALTTQGLKKLMNEY